MGRAPRGPGRRGPEGEDFHLVVNATSLGLHEGDASPIDFHMLNRAGAAMDLVYGRHTTAFVKAAEEAGIRAPATLLEAVHLVNQRQRDAFMAKITKHFGDTAGLSGKKIAVWGIAFKPGTDDVREAPSITLMRHLLEQK